MHIVIDGNIGSGKSTQLGLLESQGFLVKREPIEKWPLDLLCDDPGRWGLTFQLIVLSTLNKLDGDCVIYERCPRSSKEVFWSLMEKNAYEERAYDEFFDYKDWKPDIYIYIDTPPNICLQHITRRKQSGDSIVDIVYLENIRARYEDMWKRMDCTKYRIDGSQSVQDIHKEILEYVNISKKR